MSELIVLHFNDVYNIEQPSSDAVGGAARFATIVKQYKDPLVVFSGDAFSPSMLGTAFKGQQMVPVLNKLNVQIAVYGNHDLDFGCERLIHLSSQTNFPWLLSNVVRRSDKKPLANGAICKLVEWKGRKIGFMGLVEKEWLDTLSTVNEKEIIYEDFVVVGKRLSKELREQGADLVIALT